MFLLDSAFPNFSTPQNDYNKKLSSGLHYLIFLFDKHNIHVYQAH